MLDAKHFIILAMEKDGRTRIYTTFGGEDPTAWEVFPVDRTGSHPLNGYSALELFSRVDARCFRFQPPVRTKPGEPPKKAISRWIVEYSDRTVTFDRAEIPEKGQYGELARTLESQLGKAGLTVLVTN